jgi:hypothetical protein
MNELEYLDVSQITKNNRYPFTKGQIRHFLLHRHKNGLGKAIRKIGKRLYLRRDLWERWIEDQKEGYNG